MKLTLTHTAAALKEYDNVKARMRPKFDSAETDEEYGEVFAKEAEALQALRDAFYEDTQDRNCRENCNLIDVATLRKWVEKHGRTD